MKKIVFWIDDMRNPNEHYLGDNDYPSWIFVYNYNYFKFDSYDVVWVKDYDEFVEKLNEVFPDAVCFDHDLGYGKSGMDCAKYLIDYCIDNNKKIPLFASQSSNPSGRENILSILNNYYEYQTLENFRKKIKQR